MSKNGFTKFQNILIYQVKEKMDKERLDFKDACSVVAHIYAVKTEFVMSTFVSFKENEIMLR